MKRYLLLLLFLLPGIMLCNAQVDDEEEEEERQETVEKKKKPKSKKVEEEEDDEEEEEEEEPDEPPLLPPPVPHRHFMLNPLSFTISGFEIGYGKCDEKNNYYRFYGGYYFSEEAGIYNDNDDGNGFGQPIPTVKYKDMEQFRFEFQYAKMFSTVSTLQYYYGFYGIIKSLSAQVTRTSVNSSVILTSNYKARAFAASPGLILGVRQYFKQHVFVDIFGGGGITIPLDGTNVDDIHRGTILPYKRSINPRLGLSVGITF